MNVKDFQKMVQEIVSQANELKDKHTTEKNSPVNYACIFCQDNAEFDLFLSIVQKMGKVIKETPSGPLFLIQPMKTVAGKLKLLKIRKPDPTRKECGDADFTIENYPLFKSKYLSQKGFKLILKENFEMIELIDPAVNVRTYFSNPPLDKQFKLV